MPTQKFDFLSEFILALLKELNLGDMTDDELDVYMPKLLQQAEARLGAALLPLVPDSFGERFAALLDDDNATRDEWSHFWHEAVPDFDDQVKNILKDFAQECSRILQPLSA